MKRASLIIALIVVLSLVSGASAVFGQLKEGTDAPGFSLISADGDTVSLSDYSGRVVILHFWHAN